MLTFCNFYVLWLLRCVQLRLVTVTICDINVVWCYVLSQYRGIWGVADEAALNNINKKILKIPLLSFSQKFSFLTVHTFLCTSFLYLFVLIILSLVRYVYIIISFTTGSLYSRSAAAEKRTKGQLRHFMFFRICLENGRGKTEDPDSSLEWQQLLDDVDDVSRYL